MRCIAYFFEELGRRILKKTDYTMTKNIQNDEW